MRERELLPISCVAGLLFALAATGCGLLTVAEAEAEESIRTVYVPTPPPPVLVTETLRPGQTVGHVLGTFGLSGVDIAHIVGLIQEYQNPRRFRPGTEFQLTMRPAETPTAIRLALDADRTLYLSAEEWGWAARLDSVTVHTDTVLVAGLVESNLYNATLSGDVDRLSRADAHDIIYRLSEVFAWQVDFHRDIRSGDSYRVAIERQVRPDGSVRSSRLLAAEYVNAGRSMTAIRFLEAEGAPPEFFDEKGEALRSQFLRAPLDLVRITSGFNMRRYHPVLRQRRPHLGTDYGARPGTPVRATGAGVVTRANWWGGYGRIVEIRHANNIHTRYAHLSGFARGIRPGARVGQGQTIGFVGSSGLATGPHLHYEFLRNGQHVNPARLNLPRAEPVAAQHRERFFQERDQALALLDRLTTPTLRMAEGVPDPMWEIVGRMGDD